jgi:WD40 repeat protein
MDRDNILPEDEDGEGDDFQTINEESVNGEEYEEGQILEQGMAPDDSVVRFGSGEHKDSIYSVNCVPREPYNTFISGDCDDKAIVWKIVKDEDAKQEEEEAKEGVAARMKVKTEFHKHLPGHTETVEFIKFNHDGKLMATAGMNNQIRIWNTENDFELKCALEDGPTDDLNYMEWHPKGNVIITGGKDKLIWMFNAQNGQFMNCLQGHTADVLSA